MKAAFANQIIKGIQLLEDRQGYNRSDILKKLKTLDKNISAASLSNILNGKDVGIKTIQRALDGITSIVADELGMVYEPQTTTFQSSKTASDWQPKIIEMAASEKEERGYFYHETGRLPLQQKLDFLAQAQEEIVEVGVRLNTLSLHFEHRSEHEFKGKITALLERGVHIKFYLLDPNCNEALIYFRDRSKASLQAQEAQSPTVIQVALEKLKAVARTYRSQNLAGRFELYLYKHIPYNNFLVLDGDSDEGQMRVSHYMYGIKRSESPVVEIRKQKNASLYRRYWQSYKAFVRDAVKVELS